LLFLPDLLKLNRIRHNHRKNERIMNAIQITGLTKKFPGQQVFKGFSLEIPEGSLIHISGPSGSGKTTLLRCIAGLETFDAGAIRLFDEMVQTPEFSVPPSKRKIGMVFQDLILFPHLTVMQNVDFVSKGIEKNKQRRLTWNMELLKKLKIDHKANKYPHELSGGEKQRVAIARAVAHRPKILLLDEPFSHLDDPLRDKVFDDLISLIKADNLTCLAASHQNFFFRQEEFLEMRIF
jgi:ABC-type Fe3+/spermidine/putrescine transport system ATPase subunit